MPRLSAEQLAIKRGPAIKQLDEGETELNKDVVDNYLAKLRGAINSQAAVSEVGVCRPMHVCKCGYEWVHVGACVGSLICFPGECM